MERRIRPFTLVKYREHVKLSGMDEHYPFSDQFPLVYLGELKNMPGHGVFMGHSSGKMFSGYHIVDFEELSEDET